MQNKTSLKALRGFESCARNLSFSRAGIELNVSQAAISQQIRLLEKQLGVMLFKRSTSGIELTEEALELYPILSNCFIQINDALKKFERNPASRRLSIGVVEHFALKWLLPRLEGFKEKFPAIDVCLYSVTDVATLPIEIIDLTILFGNGDWPSTSNIKLFDAPYTVLCTPKTAQRLQTENDLRNEVLLQCYQYDYWNKWFNQAGITPWRVKGRLFDSLYNIIEAVKILNAVALVPEDLFGDEIQSGALVRPFNTDINVGGYWITARKSQPISTEMNLFMQWIISEM
jgi:LysR family transcriptional regulator of beta-lactamase